MLTDHAPAVPLEGGQEGGRVEWWAFGEPLSNLAFTAATRTQSGGKERVLLEVANLSKSAAKGELNLEGGNLASARTSSLDLAAGAVRQVFLDLPAGSPPLRIRSPPILFTLTPSISTTMYCSCPPRPGRCECGLTWPIPNCGRR